MKPRTGNQFWGVVPESKSLGKKIRPWEKLCREGNLSGQWATYQHIHSGNNGRTPAKPSPSPRLWTRRGRCNTPFRPTRFRRDPRARGEGLWAVSWGLRGPVPVTAGVEARGERWKKLWSEGVPGSGKPSACRWREPWREGQWRRVRWRRTKSFLGSRGPYHRVLCSAKWMVVNLGSTSWSDSTV